MRISDWSSDVCSSDLILLAQRRCALDAQFFGHFDQLGGGLSLEFFKMHGWIPGNEIREKTGLIRCTGRCLSGRGTAVRDSSAPRQRRPQSAVLTGRSEEHTSELQSLMRISYAVFGLKKKNTS